MAGDSVGKGLPGKMWVGGEQVQPEVRDPREVPGGRAVLGLTVSLQKSRVGVGEGSWGGDRPPEKHSLGAWGGVLRLRHAAGCGAEG